MEQIQNWTADLYNNMSMLRWSHMRLIPAYMRYISLVGVGLMVVRATTFAQGQSAVSAPLEMRGPLVLQAVHSPSPDTAALVGVTPTTVVVDSTTRTAIVHVSNPTPDTVKVQLTVQDTITRSLQGTSSGPDLSQRDSLKNAHALASWITDLPKQLILAPHTIRTLTLHVSTPSAVPAGVYVAYLGIQRQTLQQAGQGTQNLQFRTVGNDSLSKAGGGLQMSINGGAPQSTTLAFKMQVDLPDGVMPSKKDVRHTVGVVTIVYRVGEKGNDATTKHR
jgi:hypothetical protein